MLHTLCQRALSEAGSRNHPSCYLLYPLVPPVVLEFAFRSAPRTDLEESRYHCTRSLEAFQGPRVPPFHRLALAAARSVFIRVTLRALISNRRLWGTLHGPRPGIEFPASAYTEGGGLRAPITTRLSGCADASTCRPATERVDLKVLIIPSSSLLRGPVE